MYDLAVDGVNDFYVRRPGAQRLVRLEPLIGIADGVNTVFRTAHAPFLASSLKIYPPNSLTSGTPSYVDADGGVVQLSAAPSVPQVASYTAVPLAAKQVVYIAWAGMQLMEALWSRGFRPSSNGATYIPATPDDDHIYVVLVNTDDTIADPVCGSLTFSTSFSQKNFLNRCIEMAYADALASDAAASDLDVRERAGGIAINATRRTKNIVDARSLAYDELIKSWYAAMDEYYPNGDHYGQYSEPPHTLEYQEIWHWQAVSGLWAPLPSPSIAWPQWSAVW